MKQSHFLARCRLVHVSAPAIAYAKDRHVLNIGMGGYVDDAAETERALAAPTVESLHSELAKVAASLTGVDINPYAVEIVRRAVPGRYVVADIMSPSLLEQFEHERFELIVVGDVIEHLDNFGLALRNLKALLAPGGFMVISTANAFAFDTIAKMLMRYEAVHDEHTCYFSYMTLKRTLEMNDLRMVDFMFYTHKHLDRFNGWMHWVGHYLGNAVATVMPQFAKGIVVVAQPSSGNSGNK
jgi:2-polyprenyl-3-methyl-5-hydroxy-6-metoxy-1,4-benzoquinol methylase